MTIKVVAYPGMKCPVPGQPRQHITDSVPVEVERTAAILRLINGGSLKVYEPAKTAPAETKKKGGDE